MRRFEFVGGGSAKFWEVGQSDATVTVRYGSLGAQGRTQVKELGSPAEAAAHTDRLIAEKLRKGYAETSAAPSAGHTGTPAVESAASSHEPEAAGSVPAAAPVGELPDEDAFEVPAGWRRMLAARRGGAPGPALPSAAKGRAAGRKVLDSVAGQVDATARATTDPELGPALRGYLDGEPGPLGGAALVAAVAMALGYHGRDQQGLALGDLLVADLGPAGAAVAATEQITVASAGSMSSLPLNRTGAEKSENYGHWRLRQYVLRRVRAHLAAAGDDDYAAARAALVPYRSGPLAARVVTSFLLPTEREWVARDVADVARDGGPLLAELLLGAVDEVDAIHALGGHLAVYRLMYDQVSMITATAAVGPPIAPVLAGWFDHEHVGADGRQRIVSLLAALPGDEPMTVLLDRLDRKYVPPAMTEMLRRFPVRGVRLLSAAAQGRSPAAREATTLLRAHVLANPAAVEAALPALDPAARERVERIRDDASALPVAGPDRLPPVLV
ncbi:WGR domain-containing protein, partial [Micromonospora chalcea]|uniref:WGR domain-containing protein n=1 Tax=Micromonospora chalcea TaxID=1874 RepID=UPI0021A4C01C